MTVEETALWHRIRDFAIDAPGAPHPYSARLAHEQGWTPRYTQAVIEEYRKFVFLAVASGHIATPSKAIDEAWHLHLLYTRNYWDEFCGPVLGRPLHHHPSSGSGAEERRFEGCYEQTLASYEAMFGVEPPSEIWLRSAMPRKRRRWQWAVPMLFLGLAGCAGEPANPLDWSGPNFLSLYAFICVLGILLALGVRRLMSTPISGPPAADWQLQPYEIALLSNGPKRAVAATIVTLVGRGELTWDPNSNTFAAANLSAQDNLLERSVAGAASRSGARYADLVRGSQAAVNEMERGLLRKGLLIDPSRIALVVFGGIGVAALVLILGMLKIQVGLSRGRPVLFLILECLIYGVVALFVLARSARRSVYGDRVVKELSADFSGLRTAGGFEATDHQSAAIALGLFGTAALVGSDYYYLSKTIAPVSSSSWASSSTSGSSDSGGSSCGGGGGGSGCGGGGGGGCGGCSS